MNPVTSIIVVTYNSSHIVGPCLDQLASHSEFELIVFDNASTDSTVADIERDFPEVRLVRSASNLGFARAVNRAAAESHGSTLVLLNPDAIFPADDLRVCLRRLRANPRIGVVAPLVAQPQGRLQVMEVGREPNLWRLFCHYSGLSRLAGKVPLFEGLYLRPGDVSRPRRVDWVSGACMVIERDLWETLGGLTERWFMYAEDIDFCMRARRSGWAIELATDAHATHVMGGSSHVSTNELTPASGSSAWLTNLFELYRDSIAPTRVASWAWRSVAWAGMISRAVAYHVRASGDAPGTWTQESAKFRAHARAIAAQPLAAQYQQAREQR